MHCDAVKCNTQSSDLWTFAEAYMAESQFVVMFSALLIHVTLGIGTFFYHKATIDINCLVYMLVWTMNE